MSLLQDLVEEIEGYAKEFLAVEVVDLGSWSDTEFNVRDMWSFAIQIKNSGPVDVKNVVLHLNPHRLGGFVELSWPRRFDYSGSGNLHVNTEWTEGTLVQRLPGIIPTGGQTRFAGGLCRAIRPTNGSQTIFEAHIAEYDLSWDAMLADETHHEYRVQGTATAEILP